MRSSVLLPQPDGPSSATNDPAAMSSPTSSTTFVPPKLCEIPASANRRAGAHAAAPGVAKIRPQPVIRAGSSPQSRIAFQTTALTES